MPGYLVSRALGLSSYCLRHVQVACSSRCRPCSSHPLPSLFLIVKTLASRVSTVSSAPDSERAITFGSFSLLGIALQPRLLLTKLARWRGGSGAWLPLFPFSFSFGVVVTPRILEKELEWDFLSVCSSFRLRGCPASALAVAGNGCRVLQECLFFGTVILFPSETLSLLRSPVSFTMFRACLPLAPALRQVLEAMLAEGALESPSVLVLAFQSSLPRGEVV